MTSQDFEGGQETAGDHEDLRIAAGTRDRLLVAAVAAIDAEGEAGLRVRDIAAMADVSFASVYHFFGSRNGLIIAAQSERIRRLTDQRTEFIDASVHWSCAEDVWRDLEALVTSALGSVQLRIDRINTFGMAMQRPELLKVIGQEQRKASGAMAETLASAQERGWLRRDVDPYAFALWMRGTVNGKLFAELDPEVDDSSWTDMTITAMRAIFALPHADHQVSEHRQRSNPDLASAPEHLLPPAPG